MRVDTMRTIAIVQARMRSTRLPGKSLADVAGRPLLLHVVERAMRAVLVDQVVVATSDDPADDAIVAACREDDVLAFRGSESDVLDRVYRAAWHHAATVVVRLTGDCPLLDPRVIDRVIDAQRTGGFDLSSNTLEPTFPDGLDVEALDFHALRRAWREARLASEREHVTPYVTNHRDLFTVTNVRHERDLSHLRWTVDEPQDLEFVRAVYAACGPGPFGMDDVLGLLERDPTLAEMNSCFERNEGYRRSLRNDHPAFSHEVDEPDRSEANPSPAPTPSPQPVRASTSAPAG